MKKKKPWIWMPHPGHFICGIDCRFRMNTYVNGYIVSTVGELLHDSTLWDFSAERKGVKLEGMGDARRADFLNKVGWADIGFDRKYETMVFKGAKSKDACCPYQMVSSELDFEGYNDPVDAFKGHMKMCKKWDSITTPIEGGERVCE